jgi:glycosyltransferase involved in cell wall biosynthesis
MIAVYREYRAAADDALPLVVLARAGLTLEQRAALDGLDARIVASASGPEVDNLMRGAAAVLYTTTEEGFGLPVLEAGEAGTPVVIDAAAELATEVLGRHCVRVSDTSLRGWATALRRAVAQGPVEAALDLPDWTAVADAYRTIYEDVSP